MSVESKKAEAENEVEGKKATTITTIGIHTTHTVAARIST